MGQAIAVTVQQRSELALAGIWQRGQDLDEMLAAADVVIDFSLPEGTELVLEAVVRHGTGSTGNIRVYFASIIRPGSWMTATLSGMVISTGGPPSIRVTSWSFNALIISIILHRWPMPTTC